MANAMWDEMQLQATYTISRDCAIGLDEPDGLMDLLQSLVKRLLCSSFCNIYPRARPFTENLVTFIPTLIAIAV